MTQGPLRPESVAIAVPATTDGRNMAGDDFALTAGWGHVGAGGAVMPGQGRIVERSYTPEERAALGDALPALGETTFDVHLNDRAILGRPLSPEEVLHFADTARRIEAVEMAMAPGNS